MKVETSLESFAELGYAIVPKVLSGTEVEALLEATQFQEAGATHERAGQPYANRAALLIPAISDLARSLTVLALVSQILPEKPFAVRAILFDKVEGANWKIPWHQDITIPAKERHDVEGYGPWSIKEGGPHAQAPTHILQNMVAIRLHLDDCHADNGPLRVVPRSHLSGRVKKADIPLMEPHKNAIELVCLRGDAILISPLTIHASSPATSPSHRRVLHIEYAWRDLDEPLEWGRRV